MITLTEGDSLDVLRATPDGTYTYVVTDPPYGLSAPPDPLEVVRQWLADGFPAGIQDGVFRATAARSRSALPIQALP